MPVSYPKLTKTKIIALFFALAALAYFLYPRDLFLANLFEQSASYERAEKYYKQYLEKHPANKNITLKLYALYQRVGEPEKAKPYLDILIAIRHKDWELSQLYLSYLDDQKLKEEAFQTRLKMAREFKADKKIPKQTIEALFDEALRYALWQQKTAEAYSILEELVAISAKPEDYLSLLLQLDQGLKKTSALKSRLEKSLEQNPENEALIEDLIQVYRVTGEDEKALHLINERLQKQAQSLKWLKVAYSFAEKNKRLEQQEELAQKIVLNTDSTKEDKIDYGHGLALLYLKEGNSEKALNALNELLLLNPDDQSLWKDKIALLSTQKRWELFFPFIEAYQKKFPNDSEIQPLLFQLYLYELKEVQKLDFYLAFLSNHPDLKKAQDVAYFYQKAKPELYEKTLTALEKIFPQNSVWLELRYQQALENKKEALALDYLLQIQNKRPLKADELEALSSLYYNSGNKDEALKALEKLAIVQPHAKNFKRLGLEYYYLHQFEKSKEYFSKAHPEVSAEAGFEYYLKEYPYDYCEYLLETQQLEKAKIQIDQLPKDTDTKRLQALQHRYDLQMAYANFQLKKYQSVQDSLNEIDAKQEDVDLKDLHQGLKEFFLPKLSSYFELTHYGDTNFYSTHLQSRQPLTSSFSLLSHLQWGHFSDLNNKQDFALLSSAVEKRFFPFKVLAGLELGLSEERKNVSPFVQLDWEASSHYELNISYQNHQLKTDLPASILEANLEDEWKIRQQGKISQKLLWGFDLGANRQVLKTGEISGGYLVNPSLQWVFFQKPYLSLAYQYLWAEQKGDDFLAKVPLIPRLNEHTLNLNYSQTFKNQLKVEANLFLGEDFSRHLHAFKGDLWGLQTQVSYSPHPALDIFLRYQYAQEADKLNVGRTHQAQAGLNFYWNHYGKRK